MDLVFRIVLLHRSLESLDNHPNKVSMSSREKEKWTEPAFFSLLQIFLIADNESYILFDESHAARCRREILSKYESLMEGDAQPNCKDLRNSDSPDLHSGEINV